MAKKKTAAEKAKREKAYAEFDRRRSAARSPKPSSRPKGPATKSQLAARKKVVAADVKSTAAKNAAGRAAATRSKYATPGLQSLVDVMGKKKKPKRK